MILVVRREKQDEGISSQPLPLLYSLLFFGNSDDDNDDDAVDDNDNNDDYDVDDN